MEIYAQMQMPDDADRWICPGTVTWKQRLGEISPPPAALSVLHLVNVYPRSTLLGVARKPRDARCAIGGK
jgi:hypothetical protein